MPDEVFTWTPPTPRDEHVRWSEDEILEAIAYLYRTAVDAGYVLAERPDKSNRKEKAVDAILKSPAGKTIAVEITAVEAFEDRFKTGKLSNDFLDPVERRLAHTVRRGVWCELPDRPFKHGENWEEMAEDLASYIEKTSSSLEEGMTIHEVSGLPEPFTLTYDPFFTVPFFFGMSSSAREETWSHLEACMIQALEHKRERLAGYSADGDRTSLVITSTEVYRLPWDRAYAAFVLAERAVGTAHVQDVVFAFTGNVDRIILMVFKGDALLKAAVNHVVMRFEPEHADAWLARWSKPGAV